MKEKIKIIEKIEELYPSEGVDKGWSEYTGGFVDSGRWYYRKMLDVDIEELKSEIGKKAEIFKLINEEY